MNRVAAQTERGSQERKILMTRRSKDQKGSVEEKPKGSGLYSLRIRELSHVTGKWKMRRFALGKFSGEADALETARPIIAAVNERNKNEPQKLDAKITFQEFVEQYWRPYAVRKKLQISTLDQRNMILDQHLFPYFGRRAMCDIAPSDIGRFLEAKAEGGYSDNTLLSFYGFLHTLFDLAQQVNIIEKSPVRSKIHRPGLDEVEKPVLKAAEIGLILSHLTDEQERLFCLLLAVTGMRVGEAQALRWTDFQAEACELSIKHTLYRKKLKQPKTKRSKSKIKLAPQIAALLLAHHRRSAFQAEDDFIFCYKDGRPMNSSALRVRLHKAMDEAKIPRVSGKYGHHIFRHLAGTILHTKTRDLKLVQGTLRHADISTTADLYVHLDDQVLNEGSEVLTAEILANCDLFVTQESEMVS
jgi:integrase